MNTAEKSELMRTGKYYLKCEQTPCKCIDLESCDNSVLISKKVSGIICGRYGDIPIKQEQPQEYLQKSKEEIRFMEAVDTFYDTVDKRNRSQAEQPIESEDELWLKVDFIINNSGKWDNALRKLKDLYIIIKRK